MRVVVETALFISLAYWAAMLFNLGASAKEANGSRPFLRLLLTTCFAFTVASGYLLYSAAFHTQFSHWDSIPYAIFIAVSVAEAAVVTSIFLLTRRH